MSKAKQALDALRLKAAEEERLESEYVARVRADLQEFNNEIPALQTTVEAGEEKRAYNLINEASSGLARDGRDFITALCWMATVAGFTAPSISLLLAVAAYEDCNVQDERGCEITDPELAEFMGCSERTIQRWRRQYLKEEKYLKVPFLQITEGDFDRELKANRPTRYRFLVADNVADAVLEARQMTLYQENRPKALKLSAIRVYDSLAKPFGTSAIRRRRKKELSPESERNRLMNTIRTSIAKLRDLDASQPGGMYANGWEVLKNELESIYNSNNPAQIVAEIKDNPMGRQSVAPSDGRPSVVLVVAIKKEEGTTHVDYSYIAPEEIRAGSNYDEVLKIPAVVRLMRRAGVLPSDDSG